MLFFIKQKHECVGCGACVAVCPKQCITMQKDEEGFLYPFENDKCVRCGKCQAVCPLNGMSKHEIVDDIKPSAYCATTKNNAVWRRSASGGAFTEICKAFGDENTIICGASWDGFKVHHMCVRGVDNIAPLCKSKYVASDTKNTFSEIKKYLDSNHKVVFCGTPCQVAGLKKVVNNTENLLLVDFICHGVGSPDVFVSCIEQLEVQLGQKIERYEFRSKRNAFETDHMQGVNTVSGEKIYLLNDPYIQLFLKQVCLRPSCGQNCRFRCEKRQGDITIADFKGLVNVYPNLLGTKKNYSSVVFNTKKGEGILADLKKQMKVFSCDIENIKKYNPLFYKHTWASDIRDCFFEEYRSDPERTVMRYTEPTKISKLTLKRKIWMFMPNFMRRMILVLFNEKKEKSH